MPVPTKGSKAELLNSIHSRQAVEGLTHNFYRYPARFSPQFARAVIRSFSQPGDLILDPFMGGGTTLIEAAALGRRAVGTDLSELATFLSKVKTQIWAPQSLNNISKWIRQLAEKINLRESISGNADLLDSAYLRNIDDQTTWPIRKFLQLSLERITDLPAKQQDFARCVFLNTGQWAFDCRRQVPSVSEFRKKLIRNCDEMIAGAIEYSRKIRRVEREFELDKSSRPVCLCRSAVGIETEQILNRIPPKLVITSPPYPGVHILYHRWQIQGRRETPAPFWISNTQDGNGASFYNFGDRKQSGLADYYAQTLSAFTSIAKVCNEETLVVQLVAFSNPEWQLPEYLSNLKKAGLREVKLPVSVNSDDGRIWRRVPNRKWYANQERASATNKEVVLFHQVK